MDQKARELYDELTNPRNALNEEEFLEKLIKFENYTKFNIYRTLLTNNNKETVRESKEYHAINPSKSLSVKQAKKSNNLRNKLEKNAIYNLVGERVSIKDIINIYSKNINNILTQPNISIREKLNELNIVYDEVDGVILPPEGDERIITGSGKGVEEKEGFDRFSLLFERILNTDNGFYTGDYRIVIGNNRKNMMRKTSYIVIEIPKINKTIFVNNEYGEATFIYDGIPLDSEIQERGKLSYKSEFTKIRFLDPVQWIKQVKEGLFKSNEGKENKFQNIRANELGSFLNREEEKIHITELFKNDKELENQWFSLNTGTRRKFKIDNLGYIAIARIFGFDGNPNELFKDKSFIELSKKIFGENHPKVIELEKNLKKFYQEDIKKIFESNKELEDKWFSLNTGTRRKKFKIDNLGYIAIARIFGLEEKRVELIKDKNFIELSKRIFGENHPKVIELVNQKEYIKNLFKNDKKLEDDRFSSNTVARKKFKIDNLGYIAITRTFGLEGNPKKLYKDENFIELSKRIFGENHPKIIELINQKEYIKNLFKNDKELEDDRFYLNNNSRRKFKIDNLGYIAIARIFGFKEKFGNELYKDENFIELSKRIFGENHPKVVELEENLEEYSIEKIKNIFKKNKELENERFSLNIESRKKFKINKLSYINIARIFGLKEKRVELIKDKNFIELSKRIFGENHPKIIELINQKEYIKNLFKNNKELEDQWFSLNTTRPRSKFKINQLSYIAIARIFGLEEKRVELFKDKNFIELSKRIFGENHPKIIELEKNLKKFSQEDIKKIFESNKELEDQWFSLNTGTRRKFKIDNLGYIAIARIFGFDGNPNELFKDKSFIELSKKIFGEDNLRVIELVNRCHK